MEIRRLHAGEDHSGIRVNEEKDGCMATARAAHMSYE